MKAYRALVAIACVVGVGCEQASQALPFEVEPGDAVARVIGPAGGTISTPAGLSLRFEAGSLADSTEIAVARSEAALASPMDGAPVEGSAFDVDPVGLGLGVPATLSLRVPGPAMALMDPVRITGVVVSGAGPTYLSGATLDLDQGILETPLPRLGTVAARFSDDAVPIEAASSIEIIDVVVPVGSPPPGATTDTPSGGAGARDGPIESSSIGARTAATARTAELTMACGGVDQQPCAGGDALIVAMSQELYDAIGGCALFVDPTIAIALTLEETGAGEKRAAGRIEVAGTVRYRTGSDGPGCGGRGGSVHAVEVADRYVLGGEDDPWTAFVHDPDDETLTFQRTTVGPVTFGCVCGGDILAAADLTIGQGSSTIGHEGLSGRVSWLVTVSR